MSSPGVPGWFRPLCIVTFSTFTLPESCKVVVLPSPSKVVKRGGEWGGNVTADAWNVGWPTWKKGDEGSTHT